MNTLVVEDHNPTAEILTRTLRATGHQPVVCHDAEEAVQLIEREGIACFQFAVLDLKLPGMDGISLCRWIREKDGGDRPYIIVGTGSDHSEELANAFDAGADDYIEKPYAFQILNLRFAIAAEQVLMREEQARLNAELNKEKDFVAALFDTAAAFIVALDTSGAIVKVNRACSELTGIGEGDLEGQLFWETLVDPGSEREEIYAQLMTLYGARARHACHFESHFTNRIGMSSTLDAGSDPRFISWLCRQVKTSDDTDPILVCVGTDITDRRRMEAQLTYLAERDPLTNLYNRSQLEPALSEAIRHTKTGVESALVCIDLDHFKTVNDSAGHSAGDELLQMVSSTLARGVRPEDTVIRMGGDEFVLVLDNITVNRAQEIAERICERIRGFKFTVGDRTFHVTSSIGMVMLKPNMTVPEAISLADDSCYASKKAGRDKVTFGGENNAIIHRTRHDAMWYERLTRAFACDEIDLFVQPIIDLKTGEAKFHEVLLRLPLREEERPPEYYNPDEFMQSARRFDLMFELDQAVIRRALAITKTDPHLNLTVNLSGRTIGDSRLPSLLINELRKANVHPSQIIFEITESELINNLDQTVEILSNLQKNGFRFALDDFGKGYSSFSYLRQLPIELLKLDGDYTLTLQSDPASAAFVRAIADLGHAIGLRCVAEFVEDEPTTEKLRELGIDFAQGYHLGRPSPIGEAICVNRENSPATSLEFSRAVPSQGQGGVMISS